ncbi:unnamed protein product [Paramecium primaurelia]|uniref:Uncharacterized protein n=1 Tax=Paramecium primaurelia TaxID=5886 RepID=A0A8S1QF49_PARPR|nr:unnamed protein product [Paramecium primaurelia]
MRFNYIVIENKQNIFFWIGFNFINFGQDQSFSRLEINNLIMINFMQDQKLSSSLSILIDQEIFEINFLIQGRTNDEIQQQIQNIIAAQQFLYKYCNWKIDYIELLENNLQKALEQFFLLMILIQDTI